MRLPVLMGVLVAFTMVLSAFSGVATTAQASAVGSAISASGSAHGASAASTGSASVAPTKATIDTASYQARLKMENNILSTLHADGIPNKYIELPNLLGTSSSSPKGINAPIASIAPAPMGIGDYGVENTTGTLTSYTYNTSSFEATANLNSIDAWYMQNQEPDGWGQQLNTILYNVTLGSSTSNGTAVNHFWTQNVPSYAASDHELYFVDNVWNFSTGGTLPSGTLMGNGTLVAPEYYYDVWPAETTDGIRVAPPFSLTLFNTATTAPAGTCPYTGFVCSEQEFGFTLSAKQGFTYPNATGVYQSATTLTYFYDKVYFKSDDAHAIPLAQYRVSGTSCGYQVGTTFCIPDDAEITAPIGPGGGSTTNIYGINETLGLQYENSAGKYVNVRAAWDTGSETGETTQGISETWSSPGTVTLSPGPSIIYGLWNASGTTASSGHIATTITLTPSNAFLFVTPPTGVGTDAGNMSWVPSPTSGSSETYWLPEINGPTTKYSGLAGLSNYDPKAIALTAATTTLTVTLVADATMGTYTPLFAWDNAQLAAISTSGSGTVAKPYILDSGIDSSMWGGFDAYNDYLFPQFPGVQIADTTDNVEVNDSQSFALSYVSPWAAPLANDGLPTSNYLPFEFYNASHVTVWDTEISGWFGPSITTGSPFSAANLGFWNVTNSLIGDNTFDIIGTNDAILTYNQPWVDTGNTIWGNWFSGSPVDGLPAYGMQLYGNGTWVWNNYVGTPDTASTPSVDFYSGFATQYWDVWNQTLSAPTASWVVNGVTLTGSVIGWTWVGGNYWLNCNTPYDNGGQIVGWDYLPLCVTTEPSSFTVSGLPAGASWSVTLANGDTQTTATSTISFALAAGSYNFTVALLGASGYVALPNVGGITVNTTGGTTQAVVVYQPGVQNLVTFTPTPEFSFPWSLDWDGVANTNSEGGPIIFTEPNGTYSYNVLAASEQVGNATAILLPTPANGNVVVAGAAVSITVTYVSLVQSAAITNPINGETLTAGSTVAVSYNYAWVSATNATLTISNHSAGVLKTVNVFISGGVAAGSVSLAFGAGNISVTLSLVSAAANSGAVWLNKTVNATVIPVAVPHQTIYTNSTVWKNESVGGSLGVGGLGAILIVVGIVVGFLIGYIIVGSGPKGGTKSSPAQPWNEAPMSSSQGSPPPPPK